VAGVGGKEEAVSGKRRKARPDECRCSLQGQDSRTETIGGSAACASSACADLVTRRGPNYGDMPSSGRVFKRLLPHAGTQRRYGTPTFEYT